MTAVSATLREIAAELRQYPERWTQGEWARDANGRRPEFTDNEPVCWCVFGFCVREKITEHAMPLLTELAGTSVPAWNDKPGRTAAEVADLFERAAEKAEA
jgi:hypothetical protein